MTIYYLENVVHKTLMHTNSLVLIAIYFLFKVSWPHYVLAQRVGNKHLILSVIFFAAFFI